MACSLEQRKDLHNLITKLKKDILKDDPKKTEAEVLDYMELVLDKDTAELTTLLDEQAHTLYRTSKGGEQAVDVYDIKKTSTGYKILYTTEKEKTAKTVNVSNNGKAENSQYNKDNLVGTYNRINRQKKEKKKEVVLDKQGSTEETDKFYNINVKDIKTINKDVNFNEYSLKTMYDDLYKHDINEDYGDMNLGFKTQEFVDSQAYILAGMDKAFQAGSYAEINYEEIEVSLDAQYKTVNDGRETAAYIEHRADRKANIKLRWNAANGTARKSEVFLHEMVHFMTSRALRLRPDLQIVLKELQKEFRKSGVTYEIFLKDIIAQGYTPSAVEVQIAKDKYEYVIGEAADPEEFFAYALTNEYVFHYIKDLKISPEILKEFKIDPKQKSFITSFKQLANALITVFNQIWLSTVQGGDKKGSDLVVDTMMQLVELQNGMDLSEKEFQELQINDEANDSFTDKMDERLSPLVSTFDNQIEEIYGNIKKSDSTSKIGKILKNNALTARLVETQLVQDIATSVAMKTDNSKWAHLFTLYRKGKNFTEKHRRGLSDALEKLVGGYFEDVDKHTRKAITSIIFNLDLASMIDKDDGITLTELKELLSDQLFANKAHENAIHNIKIAYKELEFSDEEINEQLAHATALAQTLNYGGSFIKNQQMNADNIFSMFYKSGKDNYKVNAKSARSDKQLAIIKQLDQLITLEAVRFAPAQDKNIIAKYLAKAKNIENIHGMINMYQEYVTNSVNDLRVTNYNPIQKGFFEQLNRDNLSFDLVAEDEINYYTGFFGKMTNIGYYGEINGQKYYKLVGKEHTVSFDEGMISIAGSTVPGMSFKSILTNQLTTANKEQKKKNRISKTKIDDSVENALQDMIKNGGTSEIIDVPKGAYPIPVYDVLGEIIDYKIDLNKYDKIKHMKNNTDVVKSAAYTFSKFKHRQASVIHNEEVVDTLLKYHEDNIIENSEDFVVLRKHEKGKFDEEVHGRWNRIPDYTRAYIYKKTGSHSIAVPKSMLTLITGEKEVTASNFNLGPIDVRDNKKSQKIILALEDYVKEIQGWIKETIAIRMGTVVMANAISNMTQAWVHGKVNPLEFLKRARRKWQELNDYRNMLEQVDLIKVQHVASGSPQSGRLFNQIKQLETRIKKNPFNTLVEDGQFSPIIEDININRDEDRPVGHLAKIIDDAFDKNDLMRALRPMKEVMFLDKGTSVYNSMMKFTQYGDIITREILREKMEDDAIKAGTPASPEDIQSYLNHLDQLFVNYGYIDNRYIRYAERVGGLFFTKYFFRQAKAMQGVISANPARFLALIGAEELLFEIPTPEDAYYDIFGSVNYKFGSMNPTDKLDSIFQLPLIGAFPEFSKVFSQG